MARSMFGHIDLLKENKYRVFWEGGTKEDGSRKQCSKVINGTRDDAEIYLAKKRIESGKEISCEDITIGEYWELWYKPQLYDLYQAGEKSLSTIKVYESNWRAHLKPLFFKDVMQSQTMRSIDRKLLSISGEHSRYNSMRLLRQMYNQAWNDDQLASNPFLKRTKISAPRTKRQDVLKPSEFISWVNGMKGFPHAAAVMILVFGGLRREEVVTLIWDDDIHHIARSVNGVTREYQYIHIHSAQNDYEVKETKTDESDRTVVIGGNPAKWIESLREPGKRVFHGLDGSEVLPCRLTKNYKKWCADNGIRYVTPKNLRNSYATFRQSKGCDATITSRSMGHSNLNVDYDRYFVTQEDAYIRDADNMADAVDSLLHDVTSVIACK